MKTVIHVMRHGEVDNPDGILYGRLPGYGLTELGIEMAEASLSISSIAALILPTSSPRPCCVPR